MIALKSPHTGLRWWLLLASRALRRPCQCSYFTGIPNLRLIKVFLTYQIPLFCGINTTSLTDPREVPGRGPRGSREGPMGSDMGPKGPGRVWKGYGWGLPGTEVHRRERLLMWVVRYHGFPGILLPENGLSRCSSSLLLFKRVRFEEKNQSFRIPLSNTTYHTTQKKSINGRNTGMIPVK